MAAVAIPPSLAPRTSPTFDEVAAKVDRIVGDNPTPDKYWAVQDQLTNEELAVLVDGAPSHNPIKNEAQRTKYTEGAAHSLGSKEAEDILEQAAHDAVAAARDIDRGFLSLQAEIARVDAIHHSGFSDDLRKVKENYDKVLSDSRDVAAALSAQTNQFDDVILNMVSNETLTADEKLIGVDWYIGRIEGVHADARGIEVRFESLKSEFAGLVGRFGDWAKEREGELTTQVEAAKEELIRLNEQLVALNISIAAFGGVSAIGILMLGISAFTGPLAFFLAVGGMFALGVSAAAIIGLTIARDIKKSQIANKEREIQTLEQQIEQIRKARENLELMGNDHLFRFGDNVDLLKNVWNLVSVDAITIREHLESSKLGIILPLPGHLEEALNKGNDVYKNMARYLTIYATGLGATRAAEK
ncbi:hypothetical protein BO70DRAFT_382636 [Aspergillus heteromorphus CBS 117.55]|uniref:Uncharacterized protein n=1 Tax=Aspergillus heteromorphus CBS 117.55 TaxID=1448321 RepID=A0A317V7S7_9EURO|nr:uncharacterized protein BO70DRAFT_382636 [Aspergillus heteromorphus CBS 117.55]PWY69098.1 hypothetical protein BO70DRAFT_382636 [Aspergillus heteromorphus CBS 117.55]